MYMAQQIYVVHVHVQISYLCTCVLIFYVEQKVGSTWFWWWSRVAPTPSLTPTSRSRVTYRWCCARARAAPPTSWPSLTAVVSHASTYQLHPSELLVQCACTCNLVLGVGVHVLRTLCCITKLFSNLTVVLFWPVLSVQCSFQLYNFRFTTWSVVTVVSFLSF